VEGVPGLRSSDLRYRAETLQGRAVENPIAVALCGRTIFAARIVVVVDRACCRSAAFIEWVSGQALIKATKCLSGQKRDLMAHVRLAPYCEYWMCRRLFSRSL
jgi:hypothetical protein